MLRRIAASILKGVHRFSESVGVAALMQGFGAGGTTERKVDKDNRMGYTGGKDMMEIYSVVGSGKGHNAYDCVFSHKDFFYSLRI
jgi:hypothetical protein